MKILNLYSLTVLSFRTKLSSTLQAMLRRRNICDLMGKNQRILIGFTFETDRMGRFDHWNIFLVQECCHGIHAHICFIIPTSRLYLA